MDQTKSVTIAAETTPRSHSAGAILAPESDGLRNTLPIAPTVGAGIFLSAGSMQDHPDRAFRKEIKHCHWHSRRM